MDISIDQQSNFSIPMYSSVRNSKAFIAISIGQDFHTSFKYSRSNELETQTIGISIRQNIDTSKYYMWLVIRKESLENLILTGQFEGKRDRSKQARSILDSAE